MDLSQPMDVLLQQGTSVAHKKIVQSREAGWLTSGDLDKDEYVRYLITLWHVYDALEGALDIHASHETLNAIYNPTILARTSSLVADISHLLDVPSTQWQNHPIASVFLTNLPEAINTYTSHINQISNSPDPSPLLAHAYVRYLGDLSGGQEMKRKIAKAYGLDPRDGLGLQFYEFKQMGGSVSVNANATAGDMKRIKEWFRDGMRKGAGDDEMWKLMILKEAQHAFHLNEALFNSLKASPTSSLAEENRWSFPISLSSKSLFLHTSTKQRESAIVGRFSFRDGILSLILVLGILYLIFK